MHTSGLRATLARSLHQHLDESNEMRDDRIPMFKAELVQCFYVIVRYKHVTHPPGSNLRAKPNNLGLPCE